MSFWKKVEFREGTDREKTFTTLSEDTYTTYTGDSHELEEFRSLVKRPAGVGTGEWILVNVVQYYNELMDIMVKIVDGFYEHIKDMDKFKIGGKGTYLWLDKDDENFREAKYVNPSMYINLSTKRLSEVLVNEELFPYDKPFKEGYKKVLFDAFKKVSRLYGFIYFELADNEDLKKKFPEEVFKKLEFMSKNICVFWIDNNLLRRMVIIYYKKFVETHFPRYRGKITKLKVPKKDPKHFKDEELSSRLIVRGKITRKGGPKVPMVNEK